MATRMKSKSESPNYGGKVKPTTPGIGKVSGSYPVSSGIQPSSEKQERGNRHATTNRQEQLRKAGQKAPTSTGGSDVSGGQPSTRRNDPKGVLGKGYTKK